jgi:two-component system OmpR family response regulator
MIRQGQQVAERAGEVGSGSRTSRGPRERRVRPASPRGVGVTFVCAARPVEILVVERGAGGPALEKALEPWLHVTVVPSLDERSLEEPPRFDGVVLGAQGSLDERLERCRHLRDRGYTGAVVVLCADATEGAALLDAGADDFATVPFEARELVTRVSASARRVAGTSRLRWGDLELDRVEREVRLHGRSVALTSRECEMLACLIDARGAVVSRPTLRERVWQRKDDRGSNLVEVHLSRLRDKLGEDALLIETVRRAGYRLRR